MVETTDGRRIARAARILVVTTRRAPARLVWRLELAGQPDLFALERADALAWCTEVAGRACAAALDLADEQAERDVDDAAPAPAIN